MLGAVLVPMGLHGQTLDVGDPLEDYLRLLQISGEAPLSSFSVRPLIWRSDDVGPGGERVEPLGWMGKVDGLGGVFAESVRVDPLQARMQVMLNSDFPTVDNDGAIWQGKGLNTAFEFGTTVRWKGVRLTARPMLLWSQNTSFELATVQVTGQPEYAYPWRRIDLPQRFGSESLTRIDPGQSELRVSGKGVTVGAGTRNLWWGPGIQSGIVMSNNAGGVPHAFLGTQGPRSVGIGTVEANWIWGRIGQSDWFDPAVENDQRYLTGLVFAYNPSFLSGLSLGFTRMFYAWVPPGGLGFSDYFLVFQGVTKDSQIDPENPTGDDERDQILSLFGRWTFPESSFEVYMEWARNDHSANLTDFLLEPEHSQAYTVGLQKGLELSGDRRLALRGELTHLQRAPTYLLRASPVYYTHHRVTQGYTHNGQVIGAGVGPGGNQQYLGADLYSDWGKVGLMVQRRVTDNDAFYDWAEATGASFDRHDVSVDVGASGLLFVGDLEVGGGLTYTHQWNRYFYAGKATNWNLALSAHWRPFAN